MVTYVIPSLNNNFTSMNIDLSFLMCIFKNQNMDYNLTKSSTRIKTIFGFFEVGLGEQETLFITCVAVKLLQANDKL